MIRQTALPFKIKRTEERITARSGLALYTEFIKALKVEESIDRHMPAPGSGRGFAASSYAMPITLTLYGGGEAIEDIREIRDDHSLLEIIQSKEIPSSSAIGDWLRRIGGRGGILGMEKVNDDIIRKVLARDARKGYTLIIDPTLIEADKTDAWMTYLGFKGYRPVVATLKEIGCAIAYEFKEGNDNGGRLSIIKKAFSKMPEGKEVEGVLLDAEYYSGEVIEYVAGRCKRWAIAVDKDASVMEALKAIPDEAFQPFRTKEGVLTDREIAETIHTMNSIGTAFRLVVLRWRERQGNLFKDTYSYHAIATGMIDESAEEVVWEYNNRAHIENHIKELKNGFGLGRMPSGDFGGNAVYFGIGIMTYNLFLAQRLFTMPEEWQAKTIKSIRWLLVEVGGKLIRRSRGIILKIAVGMEKYKIYQKIRLRTYEIMCT
jgi:hypothetical protein